MATIRKSVFRAELQAGHKGPALIVPFDPALEWGSSPVEIESETYGVRPGHLVRGTLNGRAFEGWIGNRWGKNFILVDATLQRAAKLAIGDLVDVAIAPRARSTAKPRTIKKKPIRSR
ncbi:MAG TPA: DUF1905 domain-containing protein [Planctomycetota bacterium]|nr:DUF1905 domain-containing protein [Planctomycetota bacterium]